MQMHVSICMTPLNLRLWPLWLGFGLKNNLVIKISVLWHKNMQNFKPSDNGIYEHS